MGLNRARVVLRDQLHTRARKRHFRNSDTLDFKRQFRDGSSREPRTHATNLSLPVYQIKERAVAVQLTCGTAAELTVDEVHPNLDQAAGPTRKPASR